MTVPPIYRKEAHILEMLNIEFTLLGVGYPYEVIRNMPLPDARLKANVRGMLYG